MKTQVRRKGVGSDNREMNMLCKDMQICLHLSSVLGVTGGASDKVGMFNGE